MAIHVHVEFVHARGTPVQLSLLGVGTVDGHSAMVFVSGSMGGGARCVAPEGS